MTTLGYKKYTKIQLNKARKYRNKGLSLNEISIIMKIPKGTIGNWVRDIQLTEEQKSRLIKKEHRNQEKFKNYSLTRRINTIKRHTKWYEQGKQISITEKELIGVIIYACEGYHAMISSEIDLVNSDYSIIKNFLNSIESIFNIDRNNWKVRVNIHPYHDEIKVKDYWHEKLKINKDKIKIYVGCNGGRRLRNNYMGCVSVRTNNIEIRCKLEGIIDKYINRNYNIESRYRK